MPCPPPTLAAQIVRHAAVLGKHDGIGAFADERLVNLGNLVNLVDTSTLTASVTPHAPATLSRT
jgi:hypothetical protein